MYPEKYLADKTHIISCIYSYIPPEKTSSIGLETLKLAAVLIMASCDSCVLPSSGLKDVFSTALLWWWDWPPPTLLEELASETPSI